MSALYMAAKMQPKSKTLATIARELAIDIACSTYSPDFAEHVAGIANMTADMLSRKYDSSKTYKLPSILLSAREETPGVRDASWWRCLPAKAPAR